MAILATLVASVILGQDRSFPVGKVNLSGATEVTGDPFKLQEPAGPCSVLIFLSHDCPIANRYAPEIKRIYNEYIEKKIPFYRVYLGSAEHYADTAVKHGNDYGLEFPIVLDPNKKLVEALNISVTPEVAVISKDYKLLYRGRIDDQNIEHGRVKEGYRRDLRVALDEILAGKPVSERATAAVGCFIPRD
ncbi:MAG: redoxin domain-containing protein [Armatimonadetes bacterium]|nr:redoxin domain-containing protein [Armatimonadota bacterium]